MPLTTSVASRPALANRTNVYTNNTPSPWTALQLQAGIKRRSNSAENGGLKKRAKISSSQEKLQESIVDEDDSGDDSNSDAEMEDICAVRTRARRGTVFGMMNAAAMGLPGSCHGLRKYFSTYRVFWKLIVRINSEYAPNIGDLRVFTQSGLIQMLFRHRRYLPHTAVCVCIFQQ